MLCHRLATHNQYEKRIKNNAIYKLNNAINDFKDEMILVDGDDETSVLKETRHWPISSCDEHED